MFEPDFWAGSPEALELSLAGTRMLAEELAQFVHDVWRRLLQRVTRRGHQPDNYQTLGGRVD